MSWFDKKPVAATSLDALALNYISDGVMILGASGEIRLINPAAQMMIGQKAEEVLNVKFTSAARLVDSQGKAVPDEINPVTIAMRSQISGSTRNFSILPPRSDKAIPVELTMKLADTAAILTLRDITRELKDEAERNDFISTASHEMRTPVASIEGFIGLAINSQTATIDERARNYLEQAHLASQHLGKLFQDLLDTTRLDDRRLVAHPVPMEVTTAVRVIVDAMTPMVTAKGLGYAFDSGEIAGAKVVAPVIYAMLDVDFLREVLENLIDNAVKYTPQGGIRVSVRGDEYNVVIGVEDSGIGIGPADLPHIFQKFYRADNRDTREVGGTGLGLHIVKMRVEAMGGRIWAESKLGEGSRFYISLPRLSANEYERRRLVIENSDKMVANKPKMV